jgi:Spirocyclase AveC-like
VLWWAIVGAAFLAFTVYLIVAWVVGPYFRSVSPGPIQPPTWMKAVQVTWMALGIPLTGWVLWRFLVAPWRRDGRPTTDGLMALACLLLVVQDPWSSYVQHWFTYNAWLPNMGSWVNGIPGWIAYGKPGAQVPEPILWSPFMYCYAFFAITVTGSGFMRRCASRWPSLGAIRLFALCAVFMFGVDVVLEGVLFLPLGFFSYAGGHWAIFPEAYHKFPAHEAVFAGTMFAVLASVRYFVDDRGHSVAERGIDTVRTRPAMKAGVRFLAIFGVFSVAVLTCYNIPSAIMAANSTAWPSDVQKRSYLMDHICGQATGRACPGPGLPIARGHATIPPRHIVPFSGSDSGPFHGPLF